jgi:two-component sensor histidine kinase
MLELATKQSFPRESLLMEELTHRVNNEFASAISVVSLAAARSVNRDVKIALIGIVDLLHNYAAVHRALRIPKSSTHVDAAAYLYELCLSISRSKLDCMNIKLFLDAHPVSMQSDRCWQLGMIVYELITNAARHAFDHRGGVIQVELRRSGAVIECGVSDNGSAQADVQSGHGLGIVKELAESLDGRFEQHLGAQGSMSTLVFPM